MKKDERQQKIAELAKVIIVKVPVSKGGIECIVASASTPGKTYKVEVDEDYHTVACECMGGKKFDCLHKQATRLHFAPYILKLRNNAINPVYQFKRNGITVKARLSQMSKAERQALKSQQRQEEANNQRRAMMHDLFDVNMVA